MIYHSLTNPSLLISLSFLFSLLISLLSSANNFKTLTNTPLAISNVFSISLSNAPFHLTHWRNCRSTFLYRSFCRSPPSLTPPGLRHKP
ncbi:hypothetical protein B9Z19DRAFT_1079288 [Tuber borchii]|uniref:Secreted protein n=1 Tax=Tuber borchii TaxID=42251 RepID=A0A2T6ZYI7_TUBBO|nr:hypothetical protein B9Z19DRAFT_1079288 [Tuber borchii]